MDRENETEIEITPEMIEAGADEIRGHYLAIRDAYPGGAEAAARDSFRAMLRVLNLRLP